MECCSLAEVNVHTNHRRPTDMLPIAQQEIPLLCTKCVTTSDKFEKNLRQMQSFMS